MQIEEKSMQLQNVSSSLAKLAPIKSSYEKLLQDIESVENERNTLELAMEQAEDLDAQLDVNRNRDYAANDEQIEKKADSIKEQFFKSKERLGQLRAEKRKRESEYKKIIRESKYAESLGVEINELNENLGEALRSQEELFKQSRDFAEQVQPG